MNPDRSATPVDAKGVSASAPAFAGGPLQARHHLALSAFWFATNLHWTALLQIIMPSQIAQIAPERQAQALSMVLGIGALVALVLPPIVGAMSDRCAAPWGRRRPYMLAGVGINLVGLFLLWHAGALLNLWYYLAGYLVIQFGNAIATAAYSGIIPDLVPMRQRGAASGYMAAMTQTGSVVGAFATGYLMGQKMAAASYLLLGVTLGLFLLWTLLGIREQPLASRPEPMDWRNLLKHFWVDPRKHPDFAWVWITRALVTMGMWTVQPFLLYYLRDVIRVANPEETVGKMLGMVLIGATFTGLLGGYLSDRIGRKRVVYFANGMIAVIAVGFLFAHSLTAVYLLGILYGLGYGAYYSVDWALGCDVLPNKEDTAKDMGVWHIAMVLPQSIAPSIAGLLLANIGLVTKDAEGKILHYGMSGYVAIFVLAAGFLLLGAVLLRNVKGVH